MLDLENILIIKTEENISWTVHELYMNCCLHSYFRFVFVFGGNRSATYIQETAWRSWCMPMYAWCYVDKYTYLGIFWGMIVVKTFKYDLYIKINLFRFCICLHLAHKHYRMSVELFPLLVHMTEKSRLFIFCWKQCNFQLDRNVCNHVSIDKAAFHF